MKVGCSGWVWVVLFAACHGKETDEVLASLRSENDRLRDEIKAVRAENLVLVEAVDVRWPITVSLKRAGGSSGRTMYRRECPNGQALKGFGARSGTVIDALVPLCAPVVKMPGAKGTRTLERELPIVGGRGGRANDTACPGQTLMVGMRGRSAEVIDALEPVCEDGKSGARVGGEGGREYERMCPVGWVAVGLTGRQGDYLESVSLTCADPRALRESAGALEPREPPPANARERLRPDEPEVDGEAEPPPTTPPAPESPDEPTP